MGVPVQAADEGYARKPRKYKLLWLMLAAFSTQSEISYSDHGAAPSVQSV